MSLVFSAIIGIEFTPEIISNTINGVVGLLMVVAAIILGLTLRRLLKRRLEKTVLDKWVIETLSAIVIVLPALLGIIGALAIWNASLITTFFATNAGNGPSILITIGWHIIQSIFIGALGYGIARTIRTLTIQGFGDHRRIDINIRTLFARILYFTILAIAAYFVLAAWDVPVGIPVAVLGAFTVTITVAFQDILKNLVAGFYILVERPFYIGDQINITSGTVTYIGRVEDIELRATRLRLTSGEEVSVPNILIFGNAVINNTHYGERRSILEVILPVAEFSRDETINMILTALREYEEVMAKPEPAVMIVHYAEGRVTLHIRFWVATGQIIDISSVMYELHQLLPNSDINVREPV